MKKVLKSSSKLSSISVYPYSLTFTSQAPRQGALIKIVSDQGEEGLSDLAPLPLWSLETLDEALHQLRSFAKKLIGSSLSLEVLSFFLKQNPLYKSVSFALESAYLSLLSFPQSFSMQASALFMGSYDTILHLASLRKKEGFRSAKLKVSHLSFKEASSLIHLLKDDFSLRIDVNRAWETSTALQFFSKFDPGTFDYVEEPFKHPQDLHLFTHPLAIDESFGKELSLDDLENLPSLTALVYKPTLQGGLLHQQSIIEWTKKRNIRLVLSSSFESSIGLLQIASLAHYLCLDEPLGIGTYHYFENSLFDLEFEKGKLKAPPCLKTLALESVRESKAEIIGSIFEELTF